MRFIAYIFILGLLSFNLAAEAWGSLNQCASIFKFNLKITESKHSIIGEWLAHEDFTVKKKESWRGTVMLFFRNDVLAVKSEINKYAPFRLKNTDNQVLKELLAVVKDPRDISSLAYNRSLDREIFLTKAKRFLELYEISQKEDFNPESLLKTPEMKSIEDIWVRYKSKGWSLIVDNSLENVARVDTRPGVKKIYLNFSKISESMEMILAEEILHVQALELIEINNKHFTEWMRKKLGFILYENLLKGVDQVTRYSWQFQHSVENKITKEIPDLILNRLKVFIIERDAVYKKVELYKRIRSSRVQEDLVYEFILDSEEPRKIAHEYIEQRAYFEDSLFAKDKLGLESIEEIIDGLGGLRIDEYDVLSNLKPVPLIPESHKVNPAKQTPAILLIDSFREGKVFERMSHELSVPEVSEILNYISLPYLTWTPFAAKMQLVGRNGYAAQGIDIYDYVIRAVEALAIYDKAHNTSYFLGVIKLLKNLRPEEETSNNKDILRVVIQKAQEHNNSKVFGEIVTALHFSPTKKGYIQDLNFSLYPFENIAKHPLRRESVNWIVVDRLIYQNIILLKTKADLSDNYEEYNFKSFAAKTAENAAGIFKTLNLPLIEKKYIRIFNQLEKEMEEYNQRNK